MTVKRNKAGSFFSRFGDLVFRVLSRFEDEGFLPRATRWLKLSLLGILIAIPGALSLDAKDNIILCYTPAVPPPVNISDIYVSPNPTKGTDTVTVRAIAGIDRSYHNNNPIITGARMRPGTDTLYYPMRAVDGKFDDTLETVEGRLYVGDIEPKTILIYVEVTTSGNMLDAEAVSVIVSEPDTLPPGSTTNMEEFDE